MTDKARQQLEFLVTLDGWASLEKLTALYDLVEATKPKRVLEIGVFAGKSLFALALPAKELGNCTVIAIDPWSTEASVEGQVDMENENWWRDNVNHELIFQKFLYQVKKLGLESVIEVHREKSADMEPPKDLDILHIDGNHGPDALNDAERFAPNVKLGGYVILDDLRWVGGYVNMAEKFIKSIGFHRTKGNEDWAIYQRVEMGPAKVADKPAWSGSPLPTIEQALDSQLTVAFITSREKPNVRWFLESLKNTGLKPAEVLIISLNKIPPDDFGAVMDGCHHFNISTHEPKPTVWQGPHRLTAENWWAASNARNTAICLCKTDWLACFDDRCVIMPGYAEAVRDAMRGNYIMCGSYQKRVDMQVQNGLISHGGTIIGDDHRLKQYPNGLMNCPPEWMFGCNFALPLAWALEVGGQDESLDGLGAEDVFFGRMLHNCGHPFRFDSRARIIEDRTASELGEPMRRTSKEKHSNDTTDKGHAAVRKFSPLKRTLHPWNLAEIREKVLAGGDWPGVENFPSVDWFDQEPIKDFVWPWIRKS